MKKTIIFFLLLSLIIAGFVILKKETTKSNPAKNFPAVKKNESINKKLSVGEKPEADLKIPNGFKIGVFAKDLPNARDLQFAPNGTLLVSLTSSGKVIALTDKDDNGEADEKKTILENLQKPHGLAFYKDKLYVAEETRVSRYNFNNSDNTATFDKKLFDLPSGGRHFTRSLLFDNSGNLYVSLGSTCDTCVEKNKFIAAVLTSNSDGQNLHTYSTGLRNAVFMALNPTTNKIYVTEMGRDFLGDNTPPDEIDILEENGNYGWPYCYGDQLFDSAFGKKDPSFCNTTIKPYYKIHAHSAPLGLTFINSMQMEEWGGDLLVAYHGSWNSSVPVGYKIVRISTKNTPEESDFITGFSNNIARPVDLAFDKEGSLFISDDKAGQVYKVVSLAN